MNDNVIPVVFCTDDNYVPYLSVTITSLKCNRDTDIYAVYVLCEILSEKSREILKSLEDKQLTINIIEILENPFEGAYEVLHISKAMYYRLMIPELLSGYKKIIYLDCDLVIKKPLSELYSIDLEDNWIGGVIDFPGKILKEYIEESLNLDGSTYINSGVLVIDTEELKKNNIAQKCLELLNTRKDFLYPDQDAINIACYGHIAFLDGKWNVQGFKKDAELLPEFKAKFLESYYNPGIIHYSTHLKPWKWLSVNRCKDWYKYTNLKYYEDKKYFRSEFAKMPVLDCAFIKQLLKNIRIQIWRIF